MHFPKFSRILIKKQPISRTSGGVGMDNTEQVWGGLFPPQSEEKKKTIFLKWPILTHFEQAGV